MADRPKPVGVIATALPLYGGRVVELAMVLCRRDGTPWVDGAECRLASGPRLLGDGATLRTCSFRVLALRGGQGGRVEALLSAPLGTLVPTAAYGDGVYLASEVATWERRDERAYIEAWKAGKEA